MEIVNRKAKFDYQIISEIEAGIIVGNGLSITSTGVLSVGGTLSTISNNVSTNTSDITTLKS